MECINNPEWWKAAGVRCLKTFAQSLIGFIGASTIVSEIDWVTALSGAALAAFLSLLNSMTGLPEVCDTPVQGKHVKEE